MSRLGHAWVLLLGLPLLAASECPTQQSKERQIVDQQQTIYLTAQPPPMYNYSLERDRTIGLYNARMGAVQTWSVWRSQTGMVEGDCPSSGYPLPYGVQLTAPDAHPYNIGDGSIVLPQAEPNGLFTNGVTTDATWVFCITAGAITPVYTEDRVTVYPYPVKVDYDTNRVAPTGGAATVTLPK